MAAKKKTLGFEEGLARLDALAAQMEAGELPLEELLACYEEGMKLASALDKKLDEVKGRMQEVRMNKDGAPETAAAGLAVQNSFLDEA